MSFLKQAGLQLAGTFCSLGMGIVFGLIGGFVTLFFYKEKNQYFYLDTEYFDNANFKDIYRYDSGKNLYLDHKAVARREEDDNMGSRGILNTEGIELKLGTRVEK